VILINIGAERLQKILFTLFVRSRDNFVIIKLASLKWSRRPRKLFRDVFADVDSPKELLSAIRPDAREHHSLSRWISKEERDGRKFTLFLLTVITFAEYRCEMPAGLSNASTYPRVTRHVWTREINCAWR